MTPADLFDAMKTHDAWVDDLMVHVQGLPVGVVVPAILLAKVDDTQACFYGPRGIGAFPQGHAEAAWAALVDVGGVLFGSIDEVRRLRQCLRDDRLSRTVAYLCSVGGNASAVLAAIDRIRAARVAVIGAGGIGSATAMALAGAGIGGLRLVDPDVVEASNLNRQFFYLPAQRGRHKVDALAEAIGARYGDVSLQCCVDAVDAHNAETNLTEVQAVVVSADEPLGLADMLFRAAAGLDVPVIGCGYVLGQAGVQFQPANGTAKDDAGAPRTIWQRIPRSVMPSFGPTNLELAGLASSLALTAVAGLLPSGQPPLEARWHTLQYPRQWLDER